MSFMLRDAESFVFVEEAEYPDDPTIGGRVKTKFIRVHPDEFELSCRKYLAEHKAILVRGRSECVAQNRADSTGYMETDNFQLLTRRSLLGEP
jgi:hypothetical protein